MDTVTDAVRRMYEEFPYPAGAATWRVGSDVRLLLSYGQLAREKGKTLHALDAGCGRALGLLGAAALQPDVQFVGIDLNRVALQEATEQVKARNIKNLRFQEVNLMTLEGLEVPPGGFDIIYSSGVVHHLQSPAEGLRKLRSVLAPHGVIAFMVYGRYGREPLYRLVRAIDLVVTRNTPIKERLAIGRALAGQAQTDALTAGPFGNPVNANDVEFVDRYLNVNETSYSVAELFTLIESTGFKFLRWSDPSEWAPHTRFPDGPLREHIAQLEPRKRYELAEQLFYRHKLSLFMGHAENSARQVPTRAQLAGTNFRVSPECSFAVESRCLRNSTRYESITLVRRAERLQIPPGAVATALMVVKDQTDHFKGQELVDALSASGLPREAVLEVLEDLLESEVIYIPHPADL